MADKTNITDFDPATGRTETKLVSEHDRGTKDRAAAIGGQPVPEPEPPAPPPPAEPTAPVEPPAEPEQS